MNARNEARFCRLLGVVQEESVGRRWHPFFQQWDQLTSGDERRSEISEHVNDTGAVQRDVDPEVSVVGDQGAVDVELESFAFYAESIATAKMRRSETAVGCSCGLEGPAAVSVN